MYQPVHLQEQLFKCLVLCITEPRKVHGEHMKHYHSTPMTIQALSTVVCTQMYLLSYLANLPIYLVGFGCTFVMTW